MVSIALGIQFMTQTLTRLIIDLLLSQQLLTPALALLPLDLQTHLIEFVPKRSLASTSLSTSTTPWTVRLLDNKIDAVNDRLDKIIDLLLGK